MCKLISNECHWDRKEKNTRACTFAQTYPDACPRSMAGEIKLKELAKKNPELRRTLERAKETTVLPTPSSLPQEKKGGFFDSTAVRDRDFLKTARRRIGRIIRRYIAVLKRLSEIPHEAVEWYRLLLIKRKQESMLRAHEVGQGLTGWPRKCFEEDLVPVRNESGSLDLCPNPA